jgi:SAM-dependent methyltransferase
MAFRTSPHTQPGWMLDEVANAGRENLDPQHVARYDLKEDAAAEAEVRLSRDRGLTHDSTVVEFGAGTGQFALAVAPWAARVVAVDVSPVMLAALRANIAAAQRTNIEVVQAGFLTYEHDGGVVDFVYSRYALHHLPDFWKAVALQRIGDLLRPDGLLRLWDVVYDFEPGQAEDRIEAWCATGGESVDDAWSRAELEEHVRDEHSTFSWLMEPMLQRCGFAIEAAEYSDDGIDAQYLLRKL